MVLGDFPLLCEVYQPWVKKNDTDSYVLVIGTTGSGKTNTAYVLATLWCGKIALRPETTAWEEKDIINALNDDTISVCIVDEGVAGFFNRDWNKKDQKESIKLSVMNRALNKFFFINAPESRLLDKDIREGNRIHGLVVCYAKKGKNIMEVDKGYALIYDAGQIPLVNQFFRDDKTFTNDRIERLKAEVPPDFEIKVPPLSDTSEVPEGEEYDLLRNFWKNYLKKKHEFRNKRVNEYQKIEREEAEKKALLNERRGQIVQKERKRL